MYICTVNKVKYNQYNKIHKIFMKNILPNVQLCQEAQKLGLNIKTVFSWCLVELYEGGSSWVPVVNKNTGSEYPTYFEFVLAPTFSEIYAELLKTKYVSYLSLDFSEENKTWIAACEYSNSEYMYIDRFHNYLQSESDAIEDAALGLWCKVSELRLKHNNN